MLVRTPTIVLAALVVLCISLDAVHADNASVERDFRELVGQAKELLRCKFHGHPRFRDQDATGIEVIQLPTSGSIPPEAEVLPALYSLRAKGNPKNPLALVVHGLGGSANNMDHLLDDLAGAGYYAVAPYI